MSRLSRIVLPAIAAVALSAAAGHAQSLDLPRLHDALHLTPAQEDAWQSFAAASRPDPEQEARDRNAQQMLPTLSAPRRVDLSIAAMRADLQSMELRGEALKTFYATLSPAQQQIFDRETQPRAQGQ